MVRHGDRSSGSRNTQFWRLAEDYDPEDEEPQRFALPGVADTPLIPSLRRRQAIWLCFPIDGSDGMGTSELAQPVGVPALQIAGSCAGDEEGRPDPAAGVVAGSGLPTGVARVIVQRGPGDDASSSK